MSVDSDASGLRTDRLCFSEMEAGELVPRPLRDGEDCVMVLELGVASWIERVELEDAASVLEIDLEAGGHTERFDNFDSRRWDLWWFLDKGETLVVRCRNVGPETVLVRLVVHSRPVSSS